VPATESATIPWKRLTAEGAAIVASILLAFAIDAWYGNTVNRALGADYEQRLASELAQIRVNLEELSRNADRSREYTVEAISILSGQGGSDDPRDLVAALYNAGRDYTRPFVMATYEDLVSTGRLGLLEDTDRREAIQRAYAHVDDLDRWREPYRDEYVIGLRSRVSQDIVNEIRDSCTDISAIDWECPTANIDLRSAQLSTQNLPINESIGLLELRRQGLFTLELTVGRAIEAVDVALTHLN
jgi:hypothetical protein